MSVVPGYSTRIENSVNAIQSYANRENLPVLNPGPGDLLDKTTPTWFRFLSELSLVIPPILIDGGSMHGRHIAPFPIILRNAGFFNSL